MTAFKVFNQEVKLDRPMWTLPPLEVSYSDSFEVQFAALSYAAPTKNRYAYKLEGFDDKFIETDRPYATYTKLGGGSYTLRVRASNQHGVWNETGIALKLAVKPPLWRTWRAYGAYLIILAGAVYLLLRMQRQRVRRAEREGRLAVVERDLELTGAVQSGFLPEHNEISTPRVQLVGLYRPADACGGDWWWHAPLSGGRHVVMVGDVTGHGPGPAMVTAAVATAFRVLLENGLDDVKHGLEMLNREVLRVAKGKYHMTMAALELEETTGRWVCHSAGAPPILSLDQNGKHKVHFCAGAPLGTEAGFETGRVEGTLEPYDRILLYTDGIPEIALSNGTAFGMRRFAQLYERTRGQHLRDAAAAIVLHADQSQEGRPQDDDWTFTMIEWG
jgi:serine phosphatase RsbU (regulator of sigma subunit)